MESITLAKLLGLFATIWGLGIAINGARIRDAITEILESKSMQLIAALIPLLMGSFFVSVHNKWSMDWTLIITLFAWLFLFAGIFRTIFTDRWVNLVIKLKDKINFQIVGSILTIIGLILLYFGFVHS